MMTVLLPRISPRVAVAWLVLSWMLGVVPSTAYAVPSFARQTNLPCSGCHTSFPELNAFGRQFKLNAYTMVAVPTVNAKDQNNEDSLKLVGIGPFSAMFQAGLTGTNKKQPGKENYDVQFPQEASIFFAGEITPNIGAFAELTYEQPEDKVLIDNIDLRFAKVDGSLLYGIDANNNPTVQDVWATTPAWGYPYIASETAPTAAATTQLEGLLEQRVAGIGGYFLWDNLVYGEVSFYRSADQGVDGPPGEDSTNTIQGVAPYWRFALQHQFDESNYLEIGTFGLESHQYPSGVSGTTDMFTDVGFDAQYEAKIGSYSSTTTFRWIYEHQNLDATFAAGKSANDSDDLNSFRLKSTLYFDFPVSLTAGVFSTFGDRDNGLYAPGDVSGSNNGKPDTSGVVGELDYYPWLNTKFGLQYTLYDRFNGSHGNYDGSGRSASDNNTLFLYTWIAF